MTSRKVSDLQAKDCILIGAGGHARVIQELAELCGANILGVCDPKFQGERDQLWHGLEVLGGDEYLSEVSPEKVLLLNGIGMMPGNRVRQVVFERFAEMGFCFPPLVHPFAWLSPYACISDGVQLIAGAVVQPGASIGTNTIVNTRSSIDHDSQLGAHCHLAPGATLCGDVRIGDGSFVGAGATVTQGISVAPQTFIKAGSLTTRDVL
ncbi:acetyltransferase [Marinobacter halodurans]|uniref:Acetyltransferase n=1 Tax=Marinobacter halodurans TaxID=2528979 RepID=A0ABY1ZLK6_9GAMM|nr:acetyltransferase [Marinobacter halodurans]TBW56705.1 acetyltransferase [Marinobacter halodurans]